VKNSSCDLCLSQGSYSILWPIPPHISVPKAHNNLHATTAWIISAYRFYHLTTVFLFIHALHMLSEVWQKNNKYSFITGTFSTQQCTIPYFSPTFHVILHFPWFFPTNQIPWLFPVSQTGRNPAFLTPNHSVPLFHQLTRLNEGISLFMSAIQRHTHTPTHARTHARTHACTHARTHTHTHTTI